MIVILLSTYNGARFLEEQLASFEWQTETDWRLIWRDDGSGDDTIKIMEKFNARNGRCQRVIGPATRLGPTASFLFLLKEVVCDLSQEDIVMFADQDDVWLPEKIQRAKDFLSPISPDFPALYFCRQKIVDINLNEIAESTKLKFVPHFPDCLAQNVAAGCTIAINCESVKIINKMLVTDNTYHDWWIFIVVSYCGGKIIYDESVNILYRQHHNNAIGAQKNYLIRALFAIQRGPRQFMNVFREHIVALDSVKNIMESDNKKIVSYIKKSISNNIKLLRSVYVLKFRRQKMSETILFYLWIMLG